MLTSGVTLSTPSRCLQSKNYSRVPHMRPSYDKEPGRRNTGRSTIPTMKRSWFSWCSHLFLCHVFSPKLIQWVHEPSRSWRVRSRSEDACVIFAMVKIGYMSYVVCHPSQKGNPVTNRVWYISIHGLMTIPYITKSTEFWPFNVRVWEGGIYPQYMIIN